MDDFILPPDPLLQRSLIPPEPNQLVPQPGNFDVGGWGSNEQGEHENGQDSDNESMNANKRRRVSTDPNIFGLDGGDAPGFDLTVHHSAPPVSLFQYVDSLSSLKKLTTNSAQELRRFASASSAEREMMAFALNLEIRDSLNTVSKAVVSDNLHPDLLKNIKTYTAAAFFSPRLPHYAAPRASTRNKQLHNLVLNMLDASRISHLPPSSDAAGIDKVITAIGNELTDLRSSVKTELSKRKEGEPGTDIGSFVANLTRNISIKVTKEHYARVALLSREYRSWELRPMTGTVAKVKYWEWVDKVLEKVRQDTKNDTDTLSRYFIDILSEDEKMFSKASGRAADPKERDEWQKQMELATGELPAK